MNVTREDVDLILDSFEVRGESLESVNLIRMYLNRQAEYIRTIKGEETPLFGRR